MNPSTHPLNLPPLPPRIAKLPRNARGYPVPFFVAWIDGVPDFRLVRPETLQDAIRRRVCWICGEPLGRFGTFALGPMCVVNRTNSEPPSHLECAEFAAQACPFMLRPAMERREDERTLSANGTAGHLIPRNPGVFALWTSRGWSLFPDHQGRTLFHVGERVSLSWWREGRAATAAEVIESIESGVPSLQALCRDNQEREYLAAEVRRTLAIVRATT